MGDLGHGTHERSGSLWRPSIEGIGPLIFGWETRKWTRIEILSEQFKPVELSDQQLDTVAGGAITKTADAASPSLFQLCCTGTPQADRVRG
jgi:hypothetical protein